MPINWREHIVLDPEIHHGEPCIKGTRISVSTIVGNVKEGKSHAEIINAYPQLNEESIQAALAYESDMACERLMRIGEKFKGWKSKKSAVEILSEMRR
jgi:uncharacterized protein (DUF433 family)